MNVPLQERVAGEGLPQRGAPSPRQDREWLVANRVGSFAMGTVDRVPQRKYHGLLISRRTEHPEPFHVLAEVAETVVAGGAEVPLYAFAHEDCVHPQGYRFLVEFAARPYPRWTYRIGSLLVERRFYLEPDEDCARIVYRVDGERRGVTMRLRPLFTCRIVHELAVKNPYFDGRHAPGSSGGQIILNPYTKLPPIGVLVAGAVYRAEGIWYEGVHLAEEERRGYPFTEDLFSPGTFTVDLGLIKQFTVHVSFPAVTPDPEFVPERPRQFDTPADRLSFATRSYLIRTPSGRDSVIAGYPWFGEWGRDTLIALPGLTLAVGDREGARRVLDSYRRNRVEGLVPNILGPSGTHDLHSVDASLWYVRAVQRLGEVEGSAAAAPYRSVVCEIIEALTAGRLAGVRITSDGELAADAFERPLTWMDAIVGGEPVTPRAPFAIEIQALFYNALRVAVEMALAAGDAEFAFRYKDIADRLAPAFRRRFWLDGVSYLADCHDGRRPDDSLRPNQVIAASLPYTPVTDEMAEKVLAAATAHLLTPYGLRTLSSDHPAYRGRCEGTQAERDRAYHQGTVWPWLLGPYGDLVLRVHGEEAGLRKIGELVAPLAAHLDAECVNHVSEIFDGDPPHAPRGAPAQAWSVAEVLRLMKRCQKP